MMFFDLVLLDTDQKRAVQRVLEPKYDFKLFYFYLQFKTIFFMDWILFFADLDLDSGKHVQSGSGQKDPDLKH